MGTCSSNTLYLGYGSNMWREQMALRCPKSTLVGIGRLDGWEWIINDRGYANVVSGGSSSGTHSQEVWGMIYTLTVEDEKRLDKNEGVPNIYAKEKKSVQFWPGKEEGKAKMQRGEGEAKEMLVYIDYERIKPSRPKEEYIYRMNRGIEDAVHAGVPAKYLRDVIRKYIPEDKEEDERLKSFAESQAREFEDQ